MDLAGLIRITILVSVVLLVLGLGLRSAAGDIDYLLRRPGLLARSVLAMNVLMPLFVLALVTLCDLRSPVKAALLALAISPIPPFLPRRQIELGAHRPYVYALFVTTSVLAIGLTPLATMLIPDGLMKGGRPINPFEMLCMITITVVIPLGAGSLARQLYPGPARLLHAIFERAGTALLLLALVTMLIAAWPAMRTLIGDGTLIAIVAFTAFGLATGHVLGGPEPGNRSVLAMATSSRHPGVALAVVSTSFPDQLLAPAAVLLAVLVAISGSALYSVWHRTTLKG